MHPIVLSTAGAYSDYRVLGIFEWLSHVTPAEALVDFLSEKPEFQQSNAFDEDEFTGWLSKGGYIRDLEHHVMHLASYGDVSEITMPDLKVAA